MLSAPDGGRDLPVRTGHFVRKAHHLSAIGSPPLVANGPPNKALVPASAPLSGRPSLGGPVSGDVSRAFQRGAAYYSDGGEDGNEPSTSGHVAADEKRRKAGLRPRGGSDYPLVSERTDGRARFEYDLANMHGGALHGRRSYSGSSEGPRWDGVSSQAAGKETSAYQGPLLLGEMRGVKRSSKEDARSAGVEWWRLPPITSPQQTVEGSRQHFIKPQRTAMVLS